MTMPELSGALADASGAQAHPGAIGRSLRKLGFTYKKDAARSFTNMFRALTEICDPYASDECWNSGGAAGCVLGQRPGALGSKAKRSGNPLPHTS